MLDPCLKLDHQVNAVCRSAWMHIRNIGKVRKYLTNADAKTIVHSLVTNKLDHHNSLLFGLNKTLLTRLQKVQNTAAKLITLSQKYDHVTPILKELHWIPVEQRIIFKIALLVYKALNEAGPAYLRELLTPYQPSRQLRSADNLDLCIPRVKLTYGSRAFSYAGPKVWNSLPHDIRNSSSLNVFKSKLKTHLFKIAYST